MKSSLQAADLITRRESLRRMGLALGLTALPNWLRLEAQTTDGGIADLSGAQLALAVAVAETILPRTDTPGAADVGIGPFFAEMHRHYMDAKEKSLMRHGLDRIAMLSADGAPGKTFSNLTRREQNDVLVRLTRSADQDDIEAFKLLRELTLIGYFTSEEVIKNVFRYDPIPGRYEEIPLSSTGNVAFSG